MKYDEYVDYNDDEKYKDMVLLFYDWEECGFSFEEAKEAGCDSTFLYEVPVADIKAVIKHFLVAENGMSEEEANKKIETHYDDLYFDYQTFIYEAFDDDVIRCMSDAIVTGEIQNECAEQDYFDPEIGTDIG